MTTTRKIRIWLVLFVIALVLTIVYRLIRRLERERSPQIANWRQSELGNERLSDG